WLRCPGGRQGIISKGRDDSRNSSGGYGRFLLAGGGQKNDGTQQEKYNSLLPGCFTHMGRSYHPLTIQPMTEKSRTT
ncbi:MAG: hypothetical protein KC443_09975, partial [Anaerolineales bacterium]|nr:hypothetical protein [Anaerolineales bacterium]